MTLTLVGHPPSTYTRGVGVVLKLLGLEFKIQALTNPAQLKTPAHLEKQPFGQIPYLVDDDFVLYESRAITRYLVRKAGNTTLIPTDPKALAIFEQAAYVEVFNFHPYAEGIIRERIYAPRFGKTADEARVEEHVTALETKLAGYERILAKTKYLAGDELTLVDLYHLPYGEALGEAGVHVLTDEAKYPNVVRWWKTIVSLPAWQEVKDEMKG